MRKFRSKTPKFYCADYCIYCFYTTWLIAAGVNDIEACVFTDAELLFRMPLTQWFIKGNIDCSLKKKTVTSIMCDKNIIAISFTDYIVAFIFLKLISLKKDFSSCCEIKHSQQVFKKSRKNLLSVEGIRKISVN